MDINKNPGSSNFNRYRNQYNNIRSGSRNLHLYSNRCIRLYFRLIRQCYYNCSTTGISAHDWNNYTTNMFCLYRKCSLEWSAFIRYMDINQNTRECNQYRNWNQYNNIRSGCRNLYLYSNKCIGMYLRVLKFCSYQCTACNSDSSDSRGYHTTHMRCSNRQCSFERSAFNRKLDPDKKSGRSYIHR